MKAKNGEFLLDQRYKALVAGKSKKLYWTWENEAHWLPNLRFILIPMRFRWIFALILLFGTAAGIAYLNLQYETFGVETNAEVTSCHGDMRHGYFLDYSYTVNDISYTGSDSVSSQACDPLLEARTIQIRYLSILPQESVYRLDYNEWGIPLIATVVIILFVAFYALCIYLERKKIKDEIIKWLKKISTDTSKFKKLEKSGVIVDGELTSAYFAYVSNPSVSLQHIRHNGKEPKIVLHAHYSFISPKGEIISGSRMIYFSNLTKSMLPQVGTPVNILYADDDCHMLL